MKVETIRIATRESPLAMWQALFIKKQLENYFPALTIQILGMTTQGDKHLNTNLSKIGGKGLFIKELEDALISNKADIAVHSMKDMTVHLPPELGIAAICERAEVEDAFVSTRYQNLAEVPSQSIIGTSSLRRKAQLLALRNDLVVEPLRGNINTRLKKLEAGNFDAIILAAVGLKRLGFGHQIRTTFNTEQFLPAIGQGALAIECLRENKQIWDIIKVLDHSPTRYCISAERAINKRLDGNCSTPIAGYAYIEGSDLILKARVGLPDGSILLNATARGPVSQAEQLGYQVANELLSQGAEKILQACL